MVSEQSTPAPPSRWTFGTPTLDDSMLPPNVAAVQTSAQAITYTVAVTNTISRDLGSLKINKAFNPLTSGFAGTFSIAYNCSDGTAHDGTATHTAGATTTISGIPTGTTCVVSEPSTPTPPSGWTFGTPTLSDSQAPTNHRSFPTRRSSALYTVAVTNTISRDLGSLKITKTFNPLTSGFAGNFSITYDCRDRKSDE